MGITVYYGLDFWNQANELSLGLYKLTSQFPAEEKFALTSKIRRSAVSIPSNLSESCGRNTLKDTLRNRLILSNDLTHANYDTLNQLVEKITSCKKLINGFAKYHKQLPDKNIISKQQYDYSRR